MKRLLTLGFLFGTVLLFMQSCQKELSLEANNNVATFSLTDDTTKECLGTPDVHGNYYNGVSASIDTNNYVTIIVNVKTTGNYVIKSDSSNGFYFLDSGFFSKTGLNSLRLQARGTPILITTSQFTFSDTTCPFLVDVKDSTGSGLGGGVDTTGTGTSFDDVSYVDNDPAQNNQWHFTDSISGKTYSGAFAAKGTLDNSNGSDVSTLTLAGETTDFTNAFGVSLDFPGNVVQTGIYEIGNSDNIIGLYTLPDGNIVYQSDETSAADGTSNSYITITSYDAATKHIQGSFHCWSEDDNGGNRTLMKGSFNAYFE